MDLKSDDVVVDSGVGIGIGSSGNAHANGPGGTGPSATGSAAAGGGSGLMGSSLNGASHHESRRHSHSHHPQGLDNHAHDHHRHGSISSLSGSGNLINGNGTVSGVNGTSSGNASNQLASPPLSHPSNATTASSTGTTATTSTTAASTTTTPPLADSARRRRHRDKERVRVTRACDRCKKRKIRCTGIQPCELCIRTDSHCTYNASYARGRQPPVATREDVARMDLDGLDVSVPSTSVHPVAGEEGHHHTSSAGGLMGSSGVSSSSIVVDVSEHQPVDSDTQDDVTMMNGSNLHAGIGGGGVGGGSIPGTAEPPSRASPEPTQTDLQGHYVGPSSGVSFLLRVQKRLHQAVSFSQASSIFTFGDAPLPDFDPSGAFCVLLSRDEASTLLKRYFDFAVPTHRFLHRPTVEGWLDEFFTTNGAMKSQEDAPARRALLFMVFAQAQEYSGSTRSKENSEISARYFLAADHQLSKERGAVRLTSVQARLCQCFWLLSQSRINHCWSLFGTAGHLALAIGLNRNRHADPAGGYTNYIELECRRRTFWCAYSLDNYLSAALGRPRTFHDEDIDQELPSCSEDGDLHADHITPRMGRGQSLMLAPVAHVKLSRIVSMILRDLYSIRPSSFSNRCALAAKYSQNLKQWRAELSQFLDDGINTALLIPIFQRQRNVLNLAYWHAVILTHRPFLLSNFARLQRNGKSRRKSGAPHKDQTDDSVHACLDAAMHVVDTVNDLIQAGQLFRAFWFTSYFAFSAVVVLYVYTIQQRTAPAETWQAYFNAATRCQTQLATLADNESQLVARYCLVLEELRIEALRQTERLHAAAAGVGNQQNGGLGSLGRNAVTADDLQNQHDQQQHQHQQNALAGLGFPDVGGADDFVGFDASPSSSLADMTSWGQFDSMVTSGFGGLEALLNDDSLRF
ncbi:fungal specific transcription factor domain-containing protein [Colletotrichum plurivorum]|uniref:Fungal specific transcription factor domain-containing protein n=1 Tax=Colletotrichum plurivorum TaxID=2175906 RepID=A0A8H6KA35_9PEZI|nr:fungal specific transcription factor domain-containing protein [Colletotrichum plurivorum]